MDLGNNILHSFACQLRSSNHNIVKNRTDTFIFDKIWDGIRDQNQQTMVSINMEVSEHRYVHW